MLSLEAQGARPVVRKKLIDDVHGRHARHFGPQQRTSGSQRRGTQSCVRLKASICPAGARGSYWARAAVASLAPSTTTIVSDVYGPRDADRRASRCVCSCVSTSTGTPIERG